MKNNTSELKSYLQNALRATPHDFALSEVRGLISRALSVVESVEDKRRTREANSQKRTASQPIFQNPIGALKYLDNELAEQQKKLKDIENRRNTPQVQDDGGNELENVFG